MDTVDYSDPNQVCENCQAYEKRMQLLKSWILLLLSLFTSCTHDEVLVETCIGETASFKWDYIVPPFYVVEWYFGKTQIAEALDEHLSQDSLSINDNYTSRLVLLDTVGFNLTNVNRDDDGDYKCILTLQSTDVRVEKKWTLNVTDCNTQSTSTSRPGEGTTTPKPTPQEVDNTLAILLGVISCVIAIGLFGVFGFLKWGRKRRHRNRSPTKRDHTEAGTPMT